MINTGVVHKNMDAQAGIFIPHMQTGEHTCKQMRTHVHAYVCTRTQCRQIWTLWHKQDSRLADLSEQCVKHIGSLGGSTATSKL